MAVHVRVMMPVMLETRRSPVPLPRVRMARVQRMHLLQMMMVIVHVIQTAVRSRIGVRRGGLAGYARAHVMMIHARMSGQTSRRAAVMMAGQRRGREAAVRVDHVAMNRWR